MTDNSTLDWVAQKAQNTKKADVSWVKNKWLDIPYASQSEAQKLDIYLPEEGGGPFPVILGIHGGAFAFGDKTDDEMEAHIKGLKHGFAVVSINYRLSGEAPFPAGSHDVKAAVRWIKANSDQYGLNPDKIASWGGSAGGYYSAVLGTTSGLDFFEDKSMGNAEQPSNVHASVAWFGAYDLVVLGEQFKESSVTPQIEQDPNDPTSHNSEFMGGALASIARKVTEANPGNHISRDTPPFLIQHGTADTVVPFKQSTDFTERMRSIVPADTEVTFEALEGQGHMGDGFYTDENLTKVFAFLERHLK
ncbi:alpha/beta hydrolase [Ruegeria atlantica]|uniref:alpha/beta hydrolase n=1 Tax=Ruegeria atlantica TaxID=81569 RepID=UPI0024950B64|nr:alpha/beta hydrolase [Ruegeria atlantica]